MPPNGFWRRLLAFICGLSRPTLPPGEGLGGERFTMSPEWRETQLKAFCKKYDKAGWPKA